MTLVPKGLRRKYKTGWIQEPKGHFGTSAAARRPFFSAAMQMTASPFAILNLSQRNPQAPRSYSS